MQSWLIELLLHLIFYLTIFIGSAYYAAQNYRQQTDPEQQPFAESGGKSAPAKPSANEGSHTARSRYSETTWGDVWSDIKLFCANPFPFLVDTADLDDDTVHHRAGLEARIYLHFLKTMLTTFTVLAVVFSMLVLPANILTRRASWMPFGYYTMTTANGFVHPETDLILHLLCSIFVSVIVLTVVYLLREHLLQNVRGELGSDQAIPPVQAYTVEIQGMRLNPPVRVDEVEAMLEARHAGLYIDVVTADDVTEIADKVESQQELIKRLARARQQHENDGVRPLDIVGPLSWMYVGERVDAIEKLEYEIRDLDRVIEEAQSRPLVGTGTAFISFKQRASASDFIKDYSDARLANKSRGYPTIGTKPTDLCFNPSLWTVGMATRPQDVCWRNLRYTRFQSWVLTIFGFIGLLVVLSFVVTPLFFVQVFLSLEEMTVEGAEEANDAVSARGAAYQRHWSRSRSVVGWNRFALSLFTPLMIMLINYVLMPLMVRWAVRHFGSRTMSAINSTNFSLVCTFMVVNLLFIPALSLGSLEAFVEVTQYVPIDQVLAQVVLYGSAGVFFIDYAAQAATLATAFYFVFHATSPKIHSWAHGSDKHIPLSWEFDFSYFYSSLLSVVSIALMFSVTVPILLVVVAVFLFIRYYLDKWQLMTAHSNAHPDPSPESTASAVFIALVVVAGLAQAAFAAWLSSQGAHQLSLVAWLAAAVLFLVILIPDLRKSLVTVSSTWTGSDSEHPETWDVPAPASYKGSYVNPYAPDASSDRRDTLRDFYFKQRGEATTLGGPIA